MALLIGVLGLKQIGVQVTTAGKQELLGHDIPAEQQAKMSVPKTPVVWAKTQHTQISLLKPCFVVRSLHLDTLPRGESQMDRGLHRFVPNGIITRPSARQKVEFVKNIPPKPPDASMNIDGELAQNVENSDNLLHCLKKPLANFDKILSEKSYLIDKWGSQNIVKVGIGTCMCVYVLKKPT